MTLSTGNVPSNTSAGATNTNSSNTNTAGSSSTLNANNNPGSMASGKTLGVHHLPVPGSKSAPKKFKGKYSNIKPFIKHYEKLCVQKEVTDEQEKIENITQYCSRDVREFIEGLPSYEGKNWKLFEQDLMEYFDAERDSKRYKKGDLEAFCRRFRHRKEKMKLSSWKWYNRGFIKIAGWLESRAKITKEEKATFFWKGIPKDFRNKLEARLLAIKPNHDMELPFDIDDVSKVAKSLLLRSRFDSERMLSETDTEADSSDDDSFADSSDSTDSDTDHSRTRSRAKTTSSSSSKDQREKSPKRVAFKEPLESEIGSSKKAAKATVPVTKSDEVENLIEKMAKLSINDPIYTVLYYRAYQLDPFIGDIMMKPGDRQQWGQRSVNRPTNENRTVVANATIRAPSVPVPFNERPAPPHMTAKPGNNVFQSQPPTLSERKCFGCGEFGHTTFSCEKMGDLANKGIVARDNSGRYIMANGSFIRRLTPDETLVDAVERLRPPQANYIAILSSDDDEEDGKVFAATRSMTRNQSGGTGNNERPRTRSYRRQETNHPKLADQENVESEQNKENTTGTLPVPIVPTPFSIDNTVFNPSNDDVFMEDATIWNNTEVKKIIEQLRPKKTPKKTDVEMNVDLQEIFRRMMGSAVTVSVEEILALSKDMSTSLKQVLKPKAETYHIAAGEHPDSSKDTENPVMAVLGAYRRRKERLIKLRMEYDGKPITAIIDTGSQLNVANMKTYLEIFKHPIDIANKTTMADANGGCSDVLCNFQITQNSDF